MKRAIILLLVLLFLYFSCTSVEHTAVEKTQKEIKEQIEVEPSFIKKAEALLTLPSDNQFISLIAQHHNTHREDVLKLLDLLAEKQSKFFRYTLNNKNYSDAWFFFNNLLALTKPTSKSIKNFYTTLAAGYDQQGNTATGIYISHTLGNTILSAKSPYTSIDNFSEILVEIHMERTYKDKYGIKRKDYSFGSGFLINSKQIITAFHVVESCFAVSTKKFVLSIMKDDKIIPSVKVKSWDSLTDIALLELEEEEFNMPVDIFTLLGDSSKLKQGDSIYCLGHHSGFTSSLTKGIVSATERRAPEVGTWIQIDANVSPGASGGMAIGEDNKIYGMIVAGIIYENLNFIIPSTILLGVLDRLKQGEQIQRPWVGLLLEEEKYKKGKIKVADIFSTSPLHMYGITYKDELIAINNQPVKTIANAQKIINSLSAGNLAYLKFLKDEKEIDCWILLHRRPDYPIYNATKRDNKLSSLYPHFGFAVNPKNKIQKTLTYNEKQLQITLYMVSRKQRYSPLDNLGVEIGDYIGFLDDYFYMKTRFIELIHIPKDQKIWEIDDFDLSDFIYRLTKGPYDENIL